MEGVKRWCRNSPKAQVNRFYCGTLPIFIAPQM